MKKALLATLALAACASSPRELQDLYPGRAYESAQAPKLVAGCIARNQLASGGPAPVMMDAPEGAIEVVVQSVQVVTMTDLYAKVSPAPSGSSIALWSRAPANRDEREKGLVQGCL